MKGRMDGIISFVGFALRSRGPTASFRRRTDYPLLGCPASEATAGRT
jgi:hypothetical protein